MKYHLRVALVAAIAVLSCLVFVPGASAHFVTNSSLTCQGLTFSWADFPQGDNQFVLKWWNGTKQTIDGWTGSNGSGSVGPIPLPVIPPNGTDVSVVGTWTADGGGSFDASQTLSCQPTVTNTSIDCSGFHFTWTSNVPSPVITVAWQSPSGWSNTTVQESGHSGTTIVPLPQTPPNGTIVTAVASWNGGSTSPISSQPTTCMPITPPPTLTPPTTPPTTTPPVITPPPAVTPTPSPATPTPPISPRHHRHHHQKTVQLVLKLSFFNQDPQSVRIAQAAQYGCRIVGPTTWLHGLVHWQVQCRNAKVLPGWHWYVDGNLVHNEHWTYTSNSGRQLNSWLFDKSVWQLPNVWGHYTITAKGKVRTSHGNKSQAASR